MRLLTFPSTGLLADSVNDADSTRKVYLLAAGLAALGVALIVITVWFWRSTRHDPELLAPLEVMGVKGFRNLDGRAQRQRLDSARPPDAEPMRWGVVSGGPVPGPEIDLRAINKSARADYDDLRDDRAAVDQPAAVALDRETAIAVEPAAADPAIVDSTEAAHPAVPAPADGFAAGVNGPAEPPPPADLDAADATAETVIDEVTILDAVPSSERASTTAPANPDSQRGVVPLLIVPIDHDLGIDSTRTVVKPSTEPARGALDRSDRHEEPPDDDPEPLASDVKPSIDPLLRKFDRNDG